MALLEEEGDMVSPYRKEGSHKTILVPVENPLREKITKVHLLMDSGMRKSI